MGNLIELIVTVYSLCFPLRPQYCDFKTLSAISAGLQTTEILYPFPFRPYQVLLMCSVIKMLNRNPLRDLNNM